jgi:hypothetical protein
MAKWKSRYGIPTFAHPHAVGIHAPKDSLAAGGPGYKLVSKSPFKRYAHEDARLPLHSHTVIQLRHMLTTRDASKAAHELYRRYRAGRHLHLTDDDKRIIRQFIKGKSKRETTPTERSHRRIF